jgi:serine/threonine protein kinase
MALASGKRFGPHEITGLLGSGGMGDVYRARDTVLLRDVAIKVLPQSLVNDANTPLSAWHPPSGMFTRRGPTVASPIRSRSEPKASLLRRRCGRSAASSC